MTGLGGLHYILTPEQAAALLHAGDPDEVRALIEEIDKNIAEADHVHSDKAWDAMHRCLSDGTLHPDGGTYPRSHALLGGSNIDAGAGYTIRYLTAEQVSDVAGALGPLDEQWFRQRFFTLDPEDYDGPRDEDAFAYTWKNFTDVRDFFAHTARLGRPMIFTVDE